MKQTYTIPNDRREDIEKLVNKYQKKATKYGTPLNVEYGAPYFTSVPVLERDEMGTVHATRENYEFEAFDLTIDCEVIKRAGYTVAAKIEHLDGGKIVTTFEGEAKAEWRTADCRCEHCGTKRDRRLTFIVRHEDGTEKQVGRSCLKDYCGIDPHAIGWNNELTELLIDYDIERYDFTERPVTRAYTTVEILALAIRVMKKQGYVPTSEPTSNRNRIIEALKGEKPNVEEMEEANVMARAIIEMSNDDATRFLLDNTKTLLENVYCKANHFGYIAYAPTAFEKYNEEMLKKAEREAQESGSEYVGKIGERLTINVKEMKLVTSWETQWGMTFLYKFIDTDNNVLVWFASSPMQRVVDGHYEDVTECDKIKAAIKDHSEREGIKQTVITRVKEA